MFKNKFGAVIDYPLVRQIEQDIDKTKDRWETQEAQLFLNGIFGNHDPKNFEHLIFDKDITEPLKYHIEQMLHCDHLPYNYGNQTQHYMKWLVRKITMPENVCCFNHIQFQGLINLQTLHHLNNQYKMQYFNKPYGAVVMQSVGLWMLKGNCWVNPDDEVFSKSQETLTYEPYSYVAIVHDAWQEKDVDMFRVQLPDIKNNKFYRPNFFIATIHNNNQVCANGLTENMAKQSLVKRLGTERCR